MDLEPFLRIMRAGGAGAATLGLIVVVGCGLIWSSWGSRRALRQCLVLSILAHGGIVIFGSRPPQLVASGNVESTPATLIGARELTVDTELDSEASSDLRDDSSDSKLTAEPILELAEDADPKPPERDRPELRQPEPPLSLSDRSELPVPSTLPRPESVLPEVEASRTEAEEELPSPDLTPDDGAVEVVESPSSELRKAESELSLNRIEPSRSRRVETKPVRNSLQDRLPFEIGRPALDIASDGLTPAPSIQPRDKDEIELPGLPTELAGDSPEAIVDPLEEVATAKEMSEPILPKSTRRGPRLADRRELDSLGLASTRSEPVRLEAVTPNPESVALNSRDRRPSQVRTDVPAVYRPRLDPSRATLARRAGATEASEQAVERALEWLARHQDPADGRWDAGTARHSDGRAVAGEESFTKHCPPGDLCFGECYYWEADTAVTGLALLAYLGAGYTHLEGVHAETVRRGINFLIAQQAADGDLRGKSRAVGMYCHAMASLAICEAYALTGDKQLRGPVERAVGFLVRSQYGKGMGWRYAPIREIRLKAGTGEGYEPHSPIGDTSVLGWVVMVLKSAQEVGIEVPRESLENARLWLETVRAGRSGGLAKYQPGKPETPTMTAEAWVCRQFLGLGGASDSSLEAERSLLESIPERSRFNVYYWYYGTIAMFQNGGEGWERWNDRVRDDLVTLQRTDGHKAGSWDPDPTQYGSHGGRVYSTALAAMSLEVYYRYLRLYENPRDRTSDPQNSPGRSTP